MFCPLDCWDSCKLKVQNGKFKIDENFFQKVFNRQGKGFLCHKLNNYFNYQRETSSKLNSNNIMLSKALKKLFLILKETKPKRVLFIKGSGNMGFFQNSTKLFFEKYGASFAIGSTCDGLGEMGVRKAIGKSLSLPLKVIENSKNIILWGRNSYITNTHLIPLIQNKHLTVIDVLPSKSAKNADKFIRIKVNRDYFLALFLSRIVIENGNYDNNGNNFKKFKSIVFSYSIDQYINLCGVSLENALILLAKMKEGASVLLGVGVAKCKECYKTTWAIFSLMKLLGYFGKQAKGVAFLGNSGYRINNPFKIKHKNKIKLFDVNPEEFDTVFVQGANPLKSFVGDWSWIKRKKLIVFGKYYDETAKNATLFIPTKDFYEKTDIRGSYFHEYVLLSDKIKCKINNEKISEYKLTEYLFNKFKFHGLKSKRKYLNQILESLYKIDDELYKNPAQSGYTGKEEFNFLNQNFEIKQKEFEIVTAKYQKGLNSQFMQDENLYINPESKNIMLNWINKRFDQQLIKFDENIPVNVIYTRNRCINKYIKAKGANAYYENI